MRFFLGKLLELIGFAHVGYALFVGLTQEHAMGPELRLLMLGAAIFYAGWWLERGAVA